MGWPRRSLLLGGLLLGAVTAGAAPTDPPTPGTLADCAPSFLAMDPDGTGYAFSVILRDAAGVTIWDRTWTFPTPARCREAFASAWAIQRLLLIPTLTVQECR